MSEAARIVLVDDDPNLLRLLSIRLRRAGYEVDTAENGKQALARVVAFRPHLVVTDVRMQEMDGLRLFDELHAREPMLPVILLTAHGTIRDAVNATQRGVFAYLTKPFDAEELLETVARALQLGTAPALAGDAAAERWRDDIITRSSVMEMVLQQARKVAQMDSSVLILGESGTGKDLFANAVHRASRRRDGPFVAVNCTAIPEPLFESELFGHQKGAFTGAAASRAGLLAATRGGTLFLDEIGDMPLALQSKLLRALEEREIRPVGATDAIPIDVRVLSATNQDLEAAVERKTFREDLFYRLNVVTLEIPALGARREDIPLLAEHFLAEIRARDLGATGVVKGFARDAMEELVATAWPGNVRQLRNVVEQCVVLSTSALIPPSLVQRALRGKQRDVQPFMEARERFELDYLIKLLQSTRGNVAQAARLAGRSRSELYKLLRRHQVDPEIFREA